MGEIMKTLMTVLLCSGFGFTAQAYEPVTCKSDIGKSYFTVVVCDYISTKTSSPVILPGSGYRFTNYRFNGYSGNEPTHCFRRTSGGLAMKLNSSTAESVSFFRRPFAYDVVGNKLKVLYVEGNSEMFSCQPVGR
jgi:hypothetical protein